MTKYLEVAHSKAQAELMKLKGFGELEIQTVTDGIKRDYQLARAAAAKELGIVASHPYLFAAAAFMAGIVGTIIVIFR